MAKRRKLAERSASLEKSAGSETEQPSELPMQDPAVSAQPKRFACVFAKRHPFNTAIGRACRIPGFVSVAKLKEHLYRNHRKPIQCPRCLSKFEVDNELDNHLKAPERCPQVESSQENFELSVSQVNELKQKKRTKNLSEEDRWRKVYKIAFPDTDEANIPDPYCDPDALFHQSTQLEYFLRRKIISETERMLSTEFTHVPTEITRHLPPLFLSVIEKLCTQFHRCEGTEIPDTAIQTSRAEPDVHNSLENVSTGILVSGLQRTAVGAPRVQGSHHIEQPNSDVVQYGQGPRVSDLSHLNPAATGENLNTAMPAFHHAMPDASFTPLNFPEMVDFGVHQFDFAYDQPYLGALEETQPEIPDCGSGE